MTVRDQLPPGGPFVRFITSVWLAIALIACLAVAGIASTLVPGWGGRFFTSFAFLAPAAAFFVNLAACTIRRFVRELRRPGRHRHGPDLLHLGLIVLVVGAAVSYRAKSTGGVTLAAGQSASLPDGSTLTVTDFRFDRYPDGRPKDWVSTLRITEGDVVALDGFELRVNQPLRRGRLSFYQSSYEEVRELVLRDDALAERVLREGESAELGGLSVLFMGADGARAIVRIGEGDAAKVVRAVPGETLGGAAVTEVRSVLASGIVAVSDPGWPVVAIALALAAAGLALTFVQKLGKAA
jgi:hypothetical protein